MDFTNPTISVREGEEIDEARVLVGRSKKLRSGAASEYRDRQAGSRQRERLAAGQEVELSPPPTPRRLSERVRDLMRRRHYSLRTEKTYIHWMSRFVRHHGGRSPEAMGAEEVVAFLTHLAVERDVSSATQRQALSALLFLYRTVLGRELAGLDLHVRAKSARPSPFTSPAPAIPTRNTNRSLWSECSAPGLAYGSAQLDVRSAMARLAAIIVAIWSPQSFILVARPSHRVDRLLVERRPQGRALRPLAADREADQHTQQREP